MTDFKTILSSGKDASPKRFHPWVFSGAIKKTRLHSNGSEVEPEEGDIVSVYSNKDEYLGTGHYSTNASIAIRIITFEEEVIDQNFWNKRIQNATDYRKMLHDTYEKKQYKSLVQVCGEKIVRFSNLKPQLLIYA